jgi:hypothetical protein
MAVLGRLLITSAERLDLPDLLSIDSYSAGDWRYFMNTLVGEDTPYIIKGFEIINPAASIGTSSCSIGIADSAMYYPGSGAGSFYYGLPAGNLNAIPLVPQLRLNAINYVYLTFTTLATAEDTRAFWDPDADGGVGAAFTQEVNTESAIEVQVNVSTGSFPDNTVPIAIIVVGPSVITSIEDARPMMFRLGTGGINPNPSNRFSWPSVPTSQYAQLETPILLTSSSGPNPFEGGDKNITSLKEWMDAVMSQLASLGGSQYWYEDVSTFNLINLFNDLNITFYSKGKYVHSSSVPGQLTLTENLVIKSVNSPQDIIISPGTIQIPDEYVVYVPRVSAQPINVLNEAVSFVHGQAYVNTPNGSIGYFSELSIGDWVINVGDPFNYTLQVEQFWTNVNGGGTTTTAASAKSITLSGPYQGATITSQATFNQGTYSITSLPIQSRANPAMAAAGGNFLWLVLRSDTIEGIASISSITVSGTLSIVDGSAASPTGTVAEIIATAHGLVDGDRITVTAPFGQAGTYTVEVIDANTFFINTTRTAVGPFIGFYGLCTTAALGTESANNGFESGETIGIAGTTNFNGEYVINYRSPTQFEFPFGSIPTPPPGSPNLATAANYAVLASSTITNTGATVITGNLGLYPGTSVVGFPPGTVSGTQDITDAAAQQAEIDANAAYIALQALTPVIIPTELGGQTLAPGTYKAASGTFTLNGTLTLTGSASSIYVFQTATTLITGATLTPVIALGGVLSSNIYWAVGSSATINMGHTGVFYGTAIAQASIGDTLGGTINGRLIALTAAVTFSAATILNAPAEGPVPGTPLLGVAATYAILGASAVTGSTGTGSTLTGNLGIYPNNATSITNFPPSTYTGVENAGNAAAQNAQIAALAAYTSLAAHAGYVAIPSILDGQTLTAGYYSELSGTFNLAASGNGTLTLTGSATDVFVFKAASILTTGSGGTPTITLTGGALASNVYWLVGSSATINSGHSGIFQGNIIAQASITDTSGGTLNGSMIALTGAVTLSTTALVNASSSGAPLPPAPPESAGTATLARLDVRSEEGITKVVQGETIDIGEGDSDNIQRYTGMSSLAQTHPDYFTGPYNTLWNLADYNGLTTDNLTLRASKLTAMMADKAQDKTIKYLTGATSAVNTTSGGAQQLTFLPASTLTIVLPGSPGNAVVTLPSSGPGISLLANQSAYVVINRNGASTPAIVVVNTANVPIDENVIVIASRLGTANTYLWNGAEVINSIPLVPSDAALIKVTYFDPISQVLPIGSPVTEDGFSVNAGDTVLFSNLTSGNNSVYMAIGTGTSIASWMLQSPFNGGTSPSSADTVIVEEGVSFKDQVGKFNDTTWVFNDKVRYFNITSGVSATINYFEQDAIAVSTLTDNTTNGTVTSYNYTGSEYAIIDFSIHRGSARDTGSMYVTSDGINVELAIGGAYILSSGVVFSGTITGVFPNQVLNLLYTTTSAGADATMKFMVRRWSDANGGPAGVPSYSGGGGGAGTPGGPANSIQFNGGSVFDGNSKFLIDDAGSYLGITGAIELNGLDQTVLSAPLTLTDNTVSPAALFSYPAATFPFAVIEYSVVRDGCYRTGRLLVANDTAITSESDDYVETNSTGVTLSATITGSNVVVQYTTTVTGFNGVFKYSGRTWS